MSGKARWNIVTPDNDKIGIIGKMAARSGDASGTFNAISRRTEALAEGIQTYIRDAGRENDVRIVEVLGSVGKIRVECDADFADQLARLPGANGKKQPAI